MEGPALVVSNLMVDYGGTRAVHGVSFSVKRGEFVTLLGPSGCGKTTTLRCIAGLEPASGGSVSIFGKTVASETSHVPPNRRGVNMVFQSYAVWPHMTVRQNVGYGLKKSGLTKEQMAQRVEDMLETVGLAQFGTRFGNELSGGQQQRVALARAVITEPDILLFDEPLSNLDAGLRDQMRLEIRELQRATGITSVYVTHDQAEAMSMSDSVVLMKDGLIEQMAHPREIYHRPRTRFAADFLGHANVVEGSILRARTTPTLTCHRFTIQGSAIVDCPRDEPSSAIFRAENVRLGADIGRCENVWPASVRDVAFLGRHLAVLLDIDGMTIRAELANSVTLDVGDRVDVGVAADDVYIIDGHD